MDAPSDPNVTLSNFQLERLVKRTARTSYPENADMRWLKLSLKAKRSGCAGKALLEKYNKWRKAVDSVKFELPRRTRS